MSDTALKNATLKRDDLVRRVDEIQHQLDEAKAALAKIDEWVATWHQLAGSIGKEGKEVESPTKNPSRARIGEAAVVIIKRLGRPVSRLEMFEALRQQGLEIKGKNPEMVLSTMLWRMQDEFVRVPGQGYWLKGIGLPIDYAKVTGAEDGGEK